MAAKGDGDAVGVAVFEGVCDADAVDDVDEDDVSLEVIDSVADGVDDMLRVYDGVVVMDAFIVPV